LLVNPGVADHVVEAQRKDFDTIGQFLSRTRNRTLQTRLQCLAIPPTACLRHQRGLRVESLTQVVDLRNIPAARLCGFICTRVTQLWEGAARAETLAV
jgi:hypothetical protein